MLKNILLYLWDRRTTVFGYAQVALGYLAATQGLFGEGTIRWILAANGLLTVMLGHYNNSQIKTLKADAAAYRDEQGGFARIGFMATLVGICLLVLSACATPRANSYDQKVQAAYATLAVVNDTAAIFRNADVITVDDARAVQAKTREALTVVDLAAVLTPVEGMSEVQRALNLLREAQNLMCASRPTEPNCQYLMQRSQL